MAYDPSREDQYEARDREARFDLAMERLRARRWLTAHGCERIADAIDRDAEALREEVNCAERERQRWGRDARCQVEEAVERGRYVVQTGNANFKDVLDAEPFLEALGAIFGERPAGDRLSLLEKALGDALDWFEVLDAADVVNPNEDGRKLIAGWRSLLGREESFNPEHEPAHDRRERPSGGPPYFCAGRYCPGLPWKPSERWHPWSCVSDEPEHASERREREAARFEDSIGRVEGADR